ncbi:jg4867 [Pararge aegeria aegeria]|uniref:Jg4867 protein n=1 Tax=Pararge aegeria aegeria TaxID=348720 RepID=A0A8S4R5W0_9NEOP|nr:jg4867 [Pararge aegeria aegeria]
MPSEQSRAGSLCGREKWLSLYRRLCGMHPHSTTMTRRRSSIVTFSFEDAWKHISNLDFTALILGPARWRISELSSDGREPAWSQRPDGLKGRLTSTV